MRNIIIQIIIVLFCILLIVNIYPLFIFIFFPLLSLMILLLNHYFKNPRFEYLPSHFLILSILGFNINHTLSILCFFSGIILILFQMDIYRNINWDNFIISILSILGLWIIYYKFMELDFIGFLLGINTMVLIFFLSYSLIEEVNEDIEDRDVII